MNQFDIVKINQEALPYAVVCQTDHYENVDQKLSWKCLNCDNKWVQTWDSIRKSFKKLTSGCYACHKKNKITKWELEWSTFGMRYLSDKVFPWADLHSKWMCLKCGKPFEKSISSVRNKTKKGVSGCPLCVLPKPKGRRASKDLIGKTLSGLFVLSQQHGTPGDRWECQCPAGHKSVFDRQALNNRVATCPVCDNLKTEGKTGEPPTNSQKAIDLTGFRFGKLYVLGKGDVKRSWSCGERHKWHTVVYWKCRCDCGRECQYPTLKLREGRRTGCGKCSGVRIHGIQFGSMLEAVVYLNLLQSGKSFKHNCVYPRLGKKRYDFYVPSENLYIETSSYNPSFNRWHQYLNKIELKRRHVETVLGGKFEFINRSCTPKELQAISTVISKPAGIP